MSVHECLEYDEVSLLTELGHEVFSNGAYLNPEGHPGLRRPEIQGAKHYPEFEKLARVHPRTELPKELIEPFDAIIVMHQPELIIHNWNRMKHKKVIWRSIGQSVPHIENMLRRFQKEGLKIVRYSEKERNILNSLPEDAIVRFYKDPKEFGNWNGKNKEVVNFTQTLKGRRQFCHHDHILQIMAGFPARVYGHGNEDLGGDLNGGSLSYDHMKGKMRDSRVFVYGGTWPASYTLSFIEAWMTGIPIVALGKDLAENLEGCPHIEFYEVHELIENGVDGFVSNSIEELRSYIAMLLEDHEIAKQISDKAQVKAKNIFGKEKVKRQWKDLLKNLGD